MVPIPRHYNDRSELRAKRMLTSINNQRNWGVDRLRQWFVDGGYYHPDQIELAFPPRGGGGWRHILNMRREKREAFIIDNPARQLENEWPAGGGHRPRRRVCSDDEEEDWD